MKYNKKPLTFEQQAELLLSRGLIAEKENLTAILHHVNYYRLSAYLYPFRSKDDIFIEETSLEKIWSHYTFDRQFRLLLLDGIERFEISIKTNLTNYLVCRRMSAFPHIDKKIFTDNCGSETIDKLLVQIRQYTKKSKEHFIKHFQETYSESKDLPLWMAVEIMTFGNILTLYHCLPKHDQSNISKVYGVPPLVLESWLKTLNYVRNLCAHHSRVWNRRLAIFPFIPRKQKMWQEPVKVLNYQRKIFSVLTILKYLIDGIAPQSSWFNRLQQLLANYPDIPLHWMGFPENWRECGLWKNEGTWL